MKYIAAYAMLVVGGNAAPSAADVTKVVEAAGGAVDADALGSLMTAIEGKDLNELLVAGETKLKSLVGSGGGGGGGAAAPAAAAVIEAPKEEEVDPMEGGMSMFGADASDY